MNQDIILIFNLIIMIQIKNNKINPFSNNNNKIHQIKSNNYKFNNKKININMKIKNKIKN